MGTKDSSNCIYFCFCFKHLAFGRTYLPAMSIACKYTNLERDDRVKSSQVTSNIVSFIEIYWSNDSRKCGI